MSSFTPDLGPWKAFNPAWTNVTVGNGVTACFYKQIGKTVFVRGRMVLGSTTVISGLITVARPVSSISYGGAVATPQGVCRLYDISPTPTAYEGLVSYLFGNVTDVALVSFGTSGANIITNPTSATSPFTWATADEIYFEYRYEAA